MTKANEIQIAYIVNMKYALTKFSFGHFTKDVLYHLHQQIITPGADKLN